MPYAQCRTYTMVFSGSLRRYSAPECRASDMTFWAAVAYTCGSLIRLEYSQPPHEVLTPRSIAEVHPVRLLTRLGCADADADGWLYMCSYDQSRTLRP